MTSKDYEKSVKKKAQYLFFEEMFSIEEIERFFQNQFNKQQIRDMINEAYK